MLAMAGAGKGVSVLVTLTNDFSKVLSSINGTRTPPPPTCFLSLFIVVNFPSMDSIKIAQSHNGVASRFQL